MIALIFVTVVPMSAMASPMVEKHIFAPDVPQKAAASDVQANSSEPPSPDKVQLVGILRIGDKPVALFKTKGDKTGRMVRKTIGETIEGMGIQRIGSNFIEVLNGNSVIQYRLFVAGKNRPAPAIEPIAQAGSGPQPVNPGPPIPGAGENQPTGGGTPTVNPQPQADKKPKAAIFGFGGGSNPSAEGAAPEGSGNAPNPSTNPFLKMMQQMQQNPAPLPPAENSGNPAAINPFNPFKRSSQ